MTIAARESKTIRRDIRVDRIGFVDELVKQYAKVQKDGVKKTLNELGIDQAQGDFFGALLTPTSENDTDAKAVLRMYEKGDLTKAEFLACIKISRNEIKKLVDLKTLDKITTTMPGEPRLNVTRLKTVEISLVQALNGLNDALKS